MTEMVTIRLRASEEVRQLVEFLGEEAVQLVLYAHILLDRAQCARSQRAAWEALLERGYLHGVVDDYRVAKNELLREAQRL